MKTINPRGTDNALPRDPAELTVAHLKALKPKGSRYDRLIGRGLVLRVAPSGKVSFRFTYRFEGKQRAVTIGTYPAQALKVLRGTFNTMVGKLEMGIDPAEQNIAARAAKQQERSAVAKQKAGLRVSGLIDQFTAYIDNPNHVSTRKRPWSEQTKSLYRNHLENYLRPRFGDMLVDDVNPRDLSAWLGEIATDAPVQSNRVLATVRVMFAWAAKSERGYIEFNPAAGIEKKGLETSKDRALDYNPEIDSVVDIGEIRKFWGGMDEINPLHRLALQMILLTAQRPSEVLKARWDHIVDDEWVLPKAVTKNRKIHKIPITPRMKFHLDEIKKFSGHTPYLFPSCRYESGKITPLKAVVPVSSNSLCYQLHRTFSDMELFTSHDLRRTVATQLTALDVNQYEIGVLLNHSNSTVTSIYARGTSKKLLLGLLNKWHRQLDKILNVDQDSNVVEFGKAR